MPSIQGLLAAVRTACENKAYRATGDLEDRWRQITAAVRCAEGLLSELNRERFLDDKRPDDKREKEAPTLLGPCCECQTEDTVLYRSRTWDKWVCHDCKEKEER